MYTNAPTRPTLTPDHQAVFDVIRHIDTHKTVPPAPGDAGRYQKNLQALISILQLDGFKAYQAERARFLQDHNVDALFLNYGTPERKEEDDPRFILKDGKRIIKLYSIENVYAFPDPEYLITRTLPAIGTSLLYALSGTGKTFVALDMALRIAHGLPWMGYQVKQGTVWYINTEGKVSFKKRLKAWYHEHPELSESPHFKVIPWSVDLRENFQDLLDTIDIMSTQEKPNLLTFDNFSMCSDIDQTKQEQVTPVLKRLNDLAQNYECHVMVIHHTNKAKDFNGSMAFRNHIDTHIEVKLEDPADQHGPRLIHSDKARDDDLFNDIKIELKQVTIYADEITGDPVTSCVAVRSETSIKQSGLSDIPQNMLDLLGDEPRSYTDWMKEVTNTLGIVKTTFNNYRDELMTKGYIEKCKVDGVRFEQYRKKAAPATDLARKNSEGEGSHD